MSVHASSHAQRAAGLSRRVQKARSASSLSGNARGFLPSTVVMSSYLLINHGNKRTAFFPVRVMQRYLFVKIIANYNPNIVPNYLINISENVVWTLIMNKLKLEGTLIADVIVIVQMELQQNNKELSSLTSLHLIVYGYKNSTNLCNKIMS